MKFIKHFITIILVLSVVGCAGGPSGQVETPPPPDLTTPTL